MPDWWMITEVAYRMGYTEAFPYERPSEIFREHAALSEFENEGDRAFDIGALAEIDDAAYDTLGDGEKAELDGVRVIHSWELSQQKHGLTATPEEIATVPGIGRVLAQQIYTSLHSSSGDADPSHGSAVDTAVNTATGEIVGS